MYGLGLVHASYLILRFCRRRRRRLPSRAEAVRISSRFASVGIKIAEFDELGLVEICVLGRADSTQRASDETWSEHEIRIIAIVLSWRIFKTSHRMTGYENNEKQTYPVATLDSHAERTSSMPGELPRCGATSMAARMHSV